MCLPDLTLLLLSKRANPDGLLRKLRGGTEAGSLLAMRPSYAASDIKLLSRNAHVILPATCTHGKADCFVHMVRQMFRAYVFQVTVFSELGSQKPNVYCVFGAEEIPSNETARKSARNSNHGPLATSENPKRIAVWCLGNYYYL